MVNCIPYALLFIILLVVIRDKRTSMRKITKDYLKPIKDNGIFGWIKYIILPLSFGVTLSFTVGTNEVDFSAILVVTTLIVTMLFSFFAVTITLASRNHSQNGNAQRLFQEIVSELLGQIAFNIAVSIFVILFSLVLLFTGISLIPVRAIPLSLLSLIVFNLFIITKKLYNILRTPGESS